jgi:hypothetical protein
MEVTQIDWELHGDTQIIWTKIDTIYTDNNLPLMKVQHFIELGASGGGVFVNAVHIGNNWGRITEQTKQQLSVVALNRVVP